MTLMFVALMACGNSASQDPVQALAPAADMPATPAPKSTSSAPVHDPVKVAEALKLLPEAEKIMSEADVNVVGALPVTGENLSSMTLSYQFRSIDHWGEALDTVGTSDAFQALVAKAAAFGTLRSAFTMIPL